MLTIVRNDRRLIYYTLVSTPATVGFGQLAGHLSQNLITVSNLRVQPMDQ